MLIAGKRIRNNTNTFFTSIDAKLNDTVIEQVLSYKLLGVSLDQDLSFTTQIDELCKKLSPYLKQKQCEIYYSAIIKPVVLYGAPVNKMICKECSNCKNELQE